MRSLVIIASILFATSTFAADMMAVRSITVTGMAHRQVVPDEAHVSVNLNAMEPKLAAAKTAHDEKLRKLMKIVKDAGIDEKKVRTQSSSTQPVYRYNNSVRSFEGYRVQTTVDITLADTSKLGALMDDVTSAGFENGANEEWGSLVSMYYTVSNPDAVRDEMLSEAIANAKNKATRMASATGAQLGRVYQVSEGDAPQFNFPRPMMFAEGMAMKASLAAAPMAPPAGEQELNATVTVMYELKD